MRLSAHAFIFLCGFSAATAQAGVLYKCSDAKGAVTIQSDPCPTGSKEIWKRDSAPPPQPTLQQIVANSVQQKNASGAAAAPAPPPPLAPPPPVAAAPGNAAAMPPPPVASAPPTPPPVAPAVAGAPSAPVEPTIKLSPPPAPTMANPACDSAKAFAASVREKIWLDLNQEQTGRLYTWVMNECAHPDDADN